MRLLILSALTLLGLAACSKNSDQGSNPPQITFISLTPDEIKNGGSPDQIIVIGFKFFDKDGDVGSRTEGEPNVILKQTHDTSVGNLTSLPIIPPEYQDPEKGIEGTAVINVPTNIFSLDSLHMQTGDTFHFEISILDHAGHESNVIITPDVYIKP